MKHLLLTTIASVVLVGCGGPSIHKVAETGNIEAVKQAIADGADLNAKHKYGLTPLHRAANGGNKEIAELLVAKGADVNAKMWGTDPKLDNYGKTPLALAIRSGNTETADLLRKHGGKTREELKVEGK